jgi:ribosomal protein S18 acetylase RimI-like enzyme
MHESGIGQLLPSDPPTKIAVCRWERSVSGITVRPYEAQDEEAVVELWEICFPDDPPWNEPRDVIRRKMTVQPELLLVALIDKRVVGTVLAGFDGFRGWVNKVATHPSHQRKGIATRLMRAAESALVDMGCLKLNLQVRAENESVVEFYQKAGYMVEDRVSMGKRLE